MEFPNNLSVNEIYNPGKIHNLKAVNNNHAALTHYIHNHTNGVSKFFKKDALAFIQHSLKYKYPEEKINTTVAEKAFQYILFNQRENKIPFPGPETADFKFIDLFAGIGGFRIAAQNIGGKCVFSSEWDEFAKKTYHHNFGEIPFGDITKPETKKFIPTGFDLLCAGFPCQPFSYAGLNKGFKDKTRGTLFFDILEILSEHKPKMFLLENVKGLKSHENGKTLNTILESLKSIGYNVQWTILNSYDFGLPQYRERLYIVGFKNKTNFAFPSPSNRGAKLKNIINKKDNRDPKLRLSEFELERIQFHFQSGEERVKHDNSKYEGNTKKGKHGVYSYQKEDGSLRFHIGDAAKTQIQEAFYACLETYAPTIIANRVPKLWDLKRKLSVLEAQRLQGFPDEYEFPVSDNQAYKQVGNSVAIPVIQAILYQMLNSK
jgi:DNA (cytosine-5)-methyltransferase 1